MTQHQIVTVDFHGQSIIASAIDGKPYVALKPLVENIGLQWEAQYKRLQRNPVLKSTMSVMDMVAEDGKTREMLCLPLSMLNGWLFGVDVNRVREEIRPKLIRYQTECFDVLYRHFMPKEPQPEPIQTALDYDRISPAQAQDLKEIINAIVAAKVHKTHGEAWARFQNKFRVNSYLELPATRHLEARQYLIAKLPGGYQGEVLAPVQDAERLQLAFDLATQTSAQVQRTVFNAVMEGAQDEWRYSRYLFAFTYDRLSDKPTLPWAKAVQHDQLIVSLDDLPRRIEGPDAVLATDAQLAAIARACINRIEARAISA